MMMSLLTLKLVIMFKDLIANGSFVTHVNQERVLLSRESTKVGITTDTITFLERKIKMQSD